MGQKKGNPIPSYQNQGYETLYPNKDRSHERTNMVANVQLDVDTNIEQYISDRLKANLAITSSGIIVNGSVRAEEYIVNIFSSSVMYSSGSTKFGDTSDDKHQFTGSVDISGSIVNPSSITFNTINVPATLEAYTFAANTTDKTIDLRMGNNATNQLGQEIYYPPVVNNSGVDLVEGTLVMIDPNDISQGQRLSVVKAIADGSHIADDIVGILTEDVAVNQEGFATWFGKVRGATTTSLQNAGLKDPAENWLEGDFLYPSPTRPGGLTKVMPSAPNWKASIGVITAKNGINLTILVRPNIRGTFNTLNDVEISNPVTGSIIYSSGSVWKSSSTIKMTEENVVLMHVSESHNYANDGAAAAGGIPLGGIYHTAGTLKIRIV